MDEFFTAWAKLFDAMCSTIAASLRDLFKLS
jgi:hypothetical protein